MAKYTINNKEVTRKEFDKQVYKGVEGTIVIEKPFFLDEVLDSLFPPKTAKINMTEKNKIGNLEGAYDFKLPVYGTIHHTEGAVFEKVQDSTMGKHIDPFYMLDIKNIKSVEIPSIGNLDRPNNFTVEGLPKLGKKETEGKLDYSEINFKLLDLMAKRFMDNKMKYPKGNTLKEIDQNEILWAAFRHIRKMIQPIKNDPETYKDHLAAVATNMSIILDQLEIKNKNA